MDKSIEIRVKPRIMPRDLVDCLLGLSVGLSMTAILFGLPALVACAITHSQFAAFVTFCVAYGVFASFAVSRLSLSPAGIRFHRLFGAPSFLSWDRVVSISVAPRSELVL